MKWIIYFLLICNIGFAAWHFQGFDNQNTSDKSLVVSDENQLILLSELRQREKNKQSKLGLKQCLSLGPFTKKSHSSKAKKLLQYNDFETQRISLRDTSRSGFWVTLPSKSRNEAKKHLKRLEKLKVKDYFFVATGSHINDISLGVYSLKSSARRRIDEMLKLGFVTEMERVALPQKVYWLNWYKDQKEQPDGAIIANLKNKFTQISIVERSCK